MTITLYCYSDIAIVVVSDVIQIQVPLIEELVVGTGRGNWSWELVVGTCRGNLSWELVVGTGRGRSVIYNNRRLKVDRYIITLQCN